MKISDYENEAGSWFVREDGSGGVLGNGKCPTLHTTMNTPHPLIRTTVRDAFLGVARKIAMTL